MKFDETYTNIDKLYEILSIMLFLVFFSIALLIFGIPLLIIHLKEKLVKGEKKEYIKHNDMH